jgi:antirestriction protein
MFQINKTKKGENMNQVVENKKEEVKQDNDSQIYVACLASYNSGILHGKWIKPENDIEDLKKQINQVLKSSPIPNAEEYAIHDYNNFPNLGEYPNLEDIIKVVDAIDEHGVDEINAFLSNYQIEDLDSFSDMFVGEYSSFSEYAEQMAEDTILIDCPEHIKSYFDYEKFERDLSMDDTEIDAPNGNVFIFRNC